MLRWAAGDIQTAYDGVDVHGIVGDFHRHIPLLPIGGTGMVAFLGSTIGNFDPSIRKQLLADISTALDPGGTFLVGTDLVKDPDRIWSAYNDAAGVTARFNLNMLTMLNRELNANFELDQYEHVADWNDVDHWIDIRIRSKAAQTVNIADLDMTIDLASGEEIRTEISAKFTLDGIAHELDSHGMTVVGQWTDTRNDFGVTLARKV